MAQKKKDEDLDKEIEKLEAEEEKLEEELEELGEKPPPREEDDEEKPMTREEELEILAEGPPLKQDFLLNPREGEEAPVGEELPILRQGGWVVLGTTASVPERHRGALACVLQAQIFEATGGEEDAISPRPYEYQPYNARILVRTRGDAEQILELTRADFVKGTNQGRHVLEGHG